MDLLAGRRSFRLTVIDCAVLVIYSALVLVTAAHHKAWADEAQSWLLARNLPLTSLFGKYLHKEGSPGLWHLLLWFLARAHVTYKAMHYWAAATAIAGIWVFLSRSPFPQVVRAVLPFTFWLMYQYAIIARSYVAVPLFVFLAASLLVQPKKHPFALAIALGLMANLCSQAFALSVGFAIVAWLRIRRGNSDSAASHPPARFGAPAAVLAAFWAAAIATAFPVKDNAYLPSSQLLTGFSKWFAILVTTTSGISQIWPASIAILGVMIAYLIASRQWKNLAPYILLQLVFVELVCRAWHFGLGLVALLGILWISWPDASHPRSRRWAWVLTFALLAVAAIQIPWSVRAIRTDLQGSYSGDQQAAAFLAQHIEGKRAAGFQFWSIGVVPYFSSNPFFNQHKEGFWSWSTSSHVDDRVDQTMLSAPDYVVIGAALRTDANTGAILVPSQPPIEAHILSTTHYRETHRFCGSAFSGAGYTELECQLILEPDGK